MSELRRQFAKRLKELRQQKGMTQQELAMATGLSVSFIRSIEQGIYAPSFESIEVIAKVLSVRVGTLFDYSSPGK
jgi:transcriptional regulator with XRE-family HTH domain